MNYQTKATGWTFTQVRAANLQKATLAHKAHAMGRCEDYAWLRTEIRLSRDEAAAQLGVTIRTAFRYDRQLEAAQ